MVRGEVERLAEKTVERQFLYELETDFELAPAASRAVLETAQQVLLPSQGLAGVREGQMRVTVVSDHERSGKPLAAMKKVSVVVTVDSGMEDLEVLKRFGAEGLRRVRLLRMTEEAIDQGGVLTQEDLARLLQTGVRTIRRGADAGGGPGDWPGAIAQGEDRGDVPASDDLFGDRAQGASCPGIGQAVRGDIWAGGGALGEGGAGSGRDGLLGERESPAGTGVPGAARAVRHGGVS
jgi:hypothetical protein